MYIVGLVLVHVQLQVNPLLLHCSRLNVTCTHDFLIAVQEHCVDCRSGVQAEPKRDCTACQKCRVQSQGTVTVVHIHVGHIS